MIVYDHIKNERLRRLVMGSVSIHSQPEEDVQRMVDRIAQLPEQGQEEMTVALENEQMQVQASLVGQVSTAQPSGSAVGIAGTGDTALQAQSTSAAQNQAAGFSQPPAIQVLPPLSNEEKKRIIDVNTKKIYSIKKNLDREILIIRESHDQREIDALADSILKAL